MSRILHITPATRDKKVKILAVDPSAASGFMITEESLRDGTQYVPYDEQVHVVDVFCTNYKFDVVAENDRQVPAVYINVIDVY